MQLDFVMLLIWFAVLNETETENKVLVNSAQLLTILNGSLQQLLSNAGVLLNCDVLPEPILMADTIYK